MKILTAATLLLAAGLSLPVHAQEVSEDDAAWAMDFAMHDAVFTMYHEIGHMLVGELGLPVLGKEEDAADSLATILLLTDEDDDDAYEALIDSADGWYFNAVNSTGSGVDDFSYYDEHSLDIQRAYAMVCMMVGKDPDAFAETADEYGLEAEQQENCAYTFDQAITSWAVVLEQHEVTDARGAEISVVYEEAGDFTEFANELEARQVLERAADLIMASYVLPGPVTFRATQCGQANAFYSPGDSEVIYCYELAEEMFRLYINDILPAYQ
ncbi:DUF4344 domain-containing metallopeptidase [Devosia neptuniae]|mgnify:CR=1 FL=1|jgi:hypothetical protein|uniref:DUF4344 domain-containing metallopeptidase n=1 Tax=Devosia TaxID=46913 RepID=UPI0022AEF1C5|nr:DUF4344 domain-containing metallopeptidase [Devosia neptuniae]MCZ4346097.1 DUF4344 domain-containing metallopeptidase [Devosia neptuniae]|tara:strand:- start:7850 stop:8656 length:807 start_codon:yes stop_codon:yes gene_type:complete